MTVGARAGAEKKTPDKDRIGLRDGGSISADMISMRLRRLHQRLPRLPDSSRPLRPRVDVYLRRGTLKITRYCWFREASRPQLDGPAGARAPAGPRRAGRYNQAAAKRTDAFDRVRRRITKPVKPSPSSIIAQVEASGTAAVKVRFPV